MNHRGVQYLVNKVSIMATKKNSYMQGMLNVDPTTNLTHNWPRFCTGNRIINYFAEINSYYISSYLLTTKITYKSYHFCVCTLYLSVN